jgi:transposase
MESTGVYWKPVYAVLEGGALEIVVANAQPVKKVPGRKTDVKDAASGQQWPIKSW